MQLIPKGFTRFLKAAKPAYDWNPEHLAECRRWLDKVTTGQCKRLMLFLPPRHGKSEQATVHYTGYRLLLDPSLRVIVGAYNHSLACSFSRQTRRLVSEFGFEFADDANKQNQWSSVSGGGLYGVGVGSGVTGFGADLAIIDDPVKSRLEAESPTYRSRVLDWYQNDLYTRLHPGAPVILIMTRWHSLDLAGQLLEQARDGGEHWDVVSLPALAEENDLIGRQPGQALWPERYNEEDFARIKKTIGSYAFSALYQQRPSPREGGMFRPEWLPVVDPRPRTGLACRAWDNAATANGNDFSAGVRIVKDGDKFVITHVWRGQVSAEQLRLAKVTQAQTDGTATVVHVPTDPGAAGLDMVASDRRALAALGFGVVDKRPTGSKEVRAMPFAAACEAGLVELERGPWNQAFIDELCGFPTGAHDDQVDAASDAYNWLAGQQEFKWYA